ncbi:Non-heme chloroperoxidase [Actinomyces bovis]|uniref:Non-heme chloroperoxidase n=1 Tax=Actinomyces bovis TaxID=1658 RepID=A0ABY1VRR2_9ACTO|nr:alpha/beta hydrolase [Actinomyces bovis]SPT54351.1 Non-heme chloroperoxidase [Actinomyces bovis]VEG56134.1 Non-heme chloroperoxidase [Actinomyces israelii]
MSTLTESPQALTREVYGPATDASAPLLVLSHGITDNAACWVEAVELWTAQGYRVLALDARGHGTSPRWQEADLVSQDSAGERLAQDLEEVLEDVRVKGLAGEGPVMGPLVLVGHSMGGVTSLVVAARRPELVDAVVAEDPAFTTATSRRVLRLTAFQRLREVQEIASDPQARFAKEITANPTWSHREVAASVKGVVDCDQAFLKTGCVGPTTPWQEVVDALSLPVLLVTGTGDDVIMNQARLAELLKRNPRLSTAIIEGAPHCVRRTYSGRFHSVVDPWLRFQTAQHPKQTDLS